MSGSLNEPTPDPSRIAPVQPPYAAEVQAALARLPADWTPPFRLFTVLAHDPDLLLHFLRGAPAYREQAKLGLRQREVLLHRVTANCRCRYEWGMRAHFFSHQAGLTDDQLFSTVYGNAEDSCWQAQDERLLIRLADELHARCDIGDGLWRELQAAFAEEAILEALMLAGYYRTVAYLANGLRLSPEPGICRPFPMADTMQGTMQGAVA